jgi:uncharacterized protein (TIGR03437 family)
MIMRLWLLLVPTVLLAQTSVFNRNLIVNGDAETGPANPDGYNPITTIPGWTVTGAPDVLTYASNYLIRTVGVHPLQSGANYFFGGHPGANSSLTQNIDLSSGASTIDGGAVTFSASAYLGGWDTQPEAAEVVIDFLDASGRPLASATVGPVTHTEREDTTGLWYRRIVGPVPGGARSARVTLRLNWVSSPYNDSCADNLTLTLNPAADPQSLLGVNLIANANAETPAVADTALIDNDMVDVPLWSRTSRFTIASYTFSGSDLDNKSPGPPDRGNYYFFGGDGDAASSASQDIDVSSAGALIDSGVVTHQFSAWLGGLATQGDSAVATLTFLNWSGQNLGTVTMGPPTSDDRGGVTSLLPYSQSGGVPPGTRVIRVSLVMTRMDGGDNDGLADSLSLVLSAGGSGGGVPAISAGSVVSASAFGGSATAAPGSWVEIYGSNLATGTRGWSGADFNGSNAPTSLDGVKVTVGGQAAFVAFVSPGQVNALLPSNLATGQQTLTLSTPKGSSSPYAITIKATQPGLLAPQSFKIGGRQYVFAILPDGAYAMPAGAIPGVNTRPAHAGETVTLYGIGFGPVTPDTPAGQLAGGPSDLLLPVSVTVGGASATLDYKGLTPGLTGVYQFNLTIPSTASGDALQLSFSMAGTPGTQQLFIAVQ